ncbi:MAG: PTS sugar transporter subunit IIA [Anaerolineales bacterium]|nr:PTS sugar transporter subunit IIA [Anaerolineales bacterium]
MNINTLLDENQVILSLKGKTKEAVVEELAGTLVSNQKICNIERFIQDVWGREKIGDTAVGFGIAIPHARSSAVLSPAIAIGRTAGLHWNGEAEGCVQLIVLLAVPEEKAANNHMAILSNVARMLVDEDSRNALLTAETPQDVLDTIEGYQRTKGGGAE